VDEVVLHFIQPFEGWLESRGLRFLSHRYKLAGNIAGADGAPLDQARIGPLLQDFFDASVGQQQAVDGAADALARLSAHADVVFLTNLPGSWNEATRGRTLARAGMDYPLFTNTGPKGAAAARLAAGRRAPVVFVDDSPVNLRSVAASLAGCTLVQFIADARFLANAEEIDGVGLKTDDWSRAEAYISRVVDGRP
jgi:hypothetical protein